MEHLVKMGEDRSAFTRVTSRSGGKRPKVRPRCWWRDNFSSNVGDLGVADK